MKRLLVLTCLAAIGSIAPGLAVAQDVAITNARVIVGTGQVIDSGTIIVRGGKIASVTPGAVPTQGLTTIDAKGMSAMPGFIDGHKHVNNGESARAQMRSLLEAGYTTVLAGGGQADANIALRDRIDKGEFVGPRIIASGQINLRQTPAEARAAVQALAAKGVKHTGEIGLTPEPAPPQAEIEVLKAIVDEAKKAGVQVNVHAVSSPAMVAAVEAGVTRLVHLPKKTSPATTRRREWPRPVRSSPGCSASAHRTSTPSQQRRRRCNGRRTTPRASATASHGPRRSSAPTATRKVAPPAPRPATRSSTRAVSGTPTPTIRRSRYSTDQNAADLVVLEHELKSYSIVFSMADIHRIIGPNSARYVGMADQIGTLEAGKLADIILLDGNPTLNIYEMLKTKVVLKEGKVVIDKR